ncbi:MAG: alginate export family protein [Planctomycetes bacterium]|nr:alginate export family protein [Planctomycetota bacterium]
MQTTLLRSLPLARRAAAVLTALAFASPAALAQDPPKPKPKPWRLDDVLGTPDYVKVSGSYRTRFESLHGQFRNSAALRDNEDQVASRLLLRMDFMRDCWGVAVEGIDGRMFNTKNDSFANNTTVDTFDLLEANASYSFAHGHKVTAGRFTMDLGSRRLIARNKYRNTINSFNGVRWEYDGEGEIDASAFWALPTMRRPTSRTQLVDNEHDWDNQTSDVQFFGGEVRAPLDEHAGVQAYLLGLQDHRAATTSRELWTPGVRYDRPERRGAISGEVEGAYQFGERGSADVEAWFGHASVGYTCDCDLEPTVRLAIDYASGNRASDSAYNRFDTLFGARRFEYGPTGIYGAIGRRNIVSPEIRVSCKPTSATWVMLAYRDLRLDAASDGWAEAGDATGQGKHVGSQIEARLRWDAVPKNLRLETGGAYFVGDDFRETSTSGRSTDTRYFFFEATVTF